MSITDELREWVTGAKPAVVDGCSISVGTMTYGCKKALLAIADRIDAEHERKVAEVASGWDYWESTHVELPKDADGVPIRVGDVLDGHGKTIEVVEMRHGRSGWVLISRDGNGYADTFAFAHHHAPTVEDVLRQVIACANNGTHVHGALDTEQIVAEFAAKLMLKED